MVTPLPGPLAHLAPLLSHYGYWAVGALVFVEDFGVPAPGETILIAAGVYAGAGRLNIVAVAALAFAAAVAGDNIGYLIGRSGGRAFVHRWGRYVFLTPKRLHTAEEFFTRNGGKVVTAARFIEGLRQANGIIAGTSGMPWRRFLAFNALGAALWVGLWATLAYLTGTHITAIYDEVTRYQLYVLIALGVAAAAFLARHLLRHRHQRRNGPPLTPQPPPPARPTPNDGGRTQPPHPPR
ncbi:DedA family protein [Streptomyces sp. NPDC001795]|uniref:DedA family protein n=1 Tax=unclassified Streptomyces TaxID=2593676 RepID=UPI0033234089